MQRVFANKAPQPIAPFSHATWAGDFLFVTGQMPIDPVTNQYLDGGISEQTHQVMSNLHQVLAAAGLSFHDVVSVRAFLADMTDYNAFNQVYQTYFSPQNLPSRTCVGVNGLAGGAKVEVDLVAMRGETGGIMESPSLGERRGQ
ncbi:MAG: enamine deaminase RidA [Sulfobacillus benefaciens]|uniref:Enamine deaminase RidA n=1 Tax=Sulfobacillus benefaciens TaxID=453960 RepID=A0A2T2X9B0_9FIRM|nr:MAG: enamine deaminase RidA [Sulfobacillus benefaciens]HBQ94169.1 enamine deaminase RidA [Sulfobacillus sp.]